MTSPCPTSETCCLFVQAANWADCDLLLSGHPHKNTLSHLILGLEYFRWWLSLSFVRYLSSLFHLYTKSLSIFTISIRYRDNWLSFQNIATLMTHWRWRGWCHCQPRWCNLVVRDFFRSGCGNCFQRLISSPASWYPNQPSILSAIQLEGDWNADTLWHSLQSMLLHPLTRLLPSPPWVQAAPKTEILNPAHFHTERESQGNGQSAPLLFAFPGK